MSRTYHIGRWLVDPSLNSVTADGETRHLEPKVMEVLVCLAEHSGETLSKEIILKTVWPDTFVTEDVLSRAIWELRRVLGDDAREPRFIQTISKRGYRLVAAVRIADAGTTSSAPAVLPDVAVPDRKMPASHHRRTAFALGATLAAAAILVLGSGTIRSQLGLKTDSPRVRSLAVLPFVNLSNDPNQESFADGITDALITDLAQIDSLRVISRTSTLHYKNTRETLPGIARELNVDGIVEGAVQRSGNHLRVTARLIDGRSDRHLEAISYERDVQDALSVQAEIAGSIAQQIRVDLTSGKEQLPARAQPPNLQALEAYLQGRFHYQNSTQIGAKKEESRIAIEDFTRAISEDPDYAPAYVALARVRVERGPLSPSANRETEEFLRKALAIDPSSADAHVVLGRLYLFSWRWEDCGREFRAAVDLNPNDAEAHARYSEYLGLTNRPEESLREAEIAKSLDPSNDRIAWEYYVRREFARFIELKGNDVASQLFGPMAHYDLGYGYERAGMHPDAIHEWEEAMAGFGHDDLAQALQRGYAADGFRGAIREWVAGLEKLAARGEPVYPEEPAYLYAVLGDNDRAFSWLEKSYQEKTHGMPFLRLDPTWDNIRSDPRFADLERRVGVP